MTAHDHADVGSSHHHEGGHVVPLWILLGVFAVLIVLTWITVAVTSIDLGALNIWVALLIAVIKAGLVAMYFMHLRWDAPFNGLILIVSLLFVAVFIGIVLIDSLAYRPNIEAAGTGDTVQAVP